MPLFPTIVMCVSIWVMIGCLCAVYFLVRYDFKNLSTAIFTILAWPLALLFELYCIFSKK